MAYRIYTWNFTGTYAIYNQQTRDLGKWGEAAKPWWTLINCWFYGGFIIVIVKTTPVGFLVDINHWLTIRIVGFIPGQFWMNPCGIYCRTTVGSVVGKWLDSRYSLTFQLILWCSQQFFRVFGVDFLESLS